MKYSTGSFEHIHNTYAVLAIGYGSTANRKKRNIQKMLCVKLTLSEALNESSNEL